jgi:guanine deaminase
MKKIFMQETIQLARKGMQNNQGGPFGAIIVKNNEIISRGNNQVTSSNDPTAHAEIVAIRNACKVLNTFQLNDCEIYTSCEPCPMCLSSIYWARLDKIVYAANRHDAKAIGFDDAFFYEELAKHPEIRQIPMEEYLREDALIAFQEWDKKEDKIRY